MRRTNGQFLLGVVLATLGLPASAHAYDRGPRLLYLNRGGATLTGTGIDDSTTNTSQIVTTGQTATVPAFERSDADWAEIAGCVRALFAPFDLVITETDPGDRPHIEAVVGGVWSDVWTAPVEGIAAFHLSLCEQVNERAIAFVFTASAPTKTNRSICETIAQEVGHALSLDHAYDCRDPMSYLECGARTFQDAALPCGEFETRPCLCGPAQNSYRHLLDVLGPAQVGGDLEPPTLTVVSPANGETVPAGTTIELAAEDNVGVVSVEMVFPLGPTLTAPPWRFEILDPDWWGPYRFVARDARGWTTSVELEIDVRAPPRGCSVSASRRGRPAGALLVLGLAAMALARRRYQRLLARPPSLTPPPPS